MKKRQRQKKIKCYVELEDAFQERVINRDMAEAKSILRKYPKFAAESPGLYERLLLDCNFKSEDEVMPWMEMLRNLGLTCSNGFAYTHCGHDKWWRALMWLLDYAPLVGASYDHYMFALGLPKELPNDILEKINEILAKARVSPH